MLPVLYKTAELSPPFVGTNDEDDDDDDNAKGAYSSEFEPIFIVPPHSSSASFRPCPESSFG